MHVKNNDSDVATSAEIQFVIPINLKMIENIDKYYLHHGQIKQFNVVLDLGKH